ncbi:hypothetical protein ACFWVB_02645 [Streptomyces microflavus]|uniref:hypothetical protein n=1 Tax=Streptomyces microflavus TaxID=1919 RepID=UPI00365F0943
MTDMVKITSFDRTFTAGNGHTGPVLADITSPTGTVYVTAHPDALVATARVLTLDQPDSPAATAVRNTRIEQTAGRLVVAVPRVPPAAHRSRGGTTVINGVHYSSSGSMTVVNGQVMGGVAQHTEHGVELHITVPTGSDVRYRSESGSLHTFGTLAAIEADSANGSVHAETVTRIQVSVDNGSVRVGRVTESMHANASNGSVRVAEYAGSACRVRAGNGSVDLTVDPAASGRLDIRAGNGSVLLRNVRHRTDLVVDAVAGIGAVRKS